MPKVHDVQPTKCATCPFRPGSKYAALAPQLAACALTDASRICHSTGSNAITRRTGKPSRLCRGARDVQLRAFHATGFITAPTDAAWQAKCKALGIPLRIK
jgi:hypothetical protein